ncbi:MAG: hypothetical protein ACLTYN_03835 [Dysosmobacter welbionis]
MRVDVGRGMAGPARWCPGGGPGVGCRRAPLQILEAAFSSLSRRPGCGGAVVLAAIDLKAAEPGF